MKKIWWFRKCLFTLSQITMQVIKRFCFKLVKNNYEASSEKAAFFGRWGFTFKTDMENFRVVCVNDRSKPDGFVGDWIKKGEIYTVVDAKKLARQRLSIGYKFAELNIDEKSVFQYFLANRFRPYNDDDAKAEEAVQELLEESMVDLVM